MEKTINNLKSQGMDNLELKLRVFSKWCCEHKEYSSYENSGKLEQVISDVKQDTINTIGQMLEELLATNNIDLQKELNEKI